MITVVETKTVKTSDLVSFIKSMNKETFMETFGSHIKSLYKNDMSELVSGLGISLADSYIANYENGYFANGEYYVGNTPLGTTIYQASKALHQAISEGLSGVDYTQNTEDHLLSVLNALGYTVTKERSGSAYVMSLSYGDVVLESVKCKTKSDLFDAFVKLIFEGEKVDSNMYYRLLSAVNSSKEDLVSFESDKVDAAGRRARKHLQELKVLCSELRNYIQDNRGQKQNDQETV